MGTSQRRKAEFAHQCYTIFPPWADPSAVGSNIEFSVKAPLGFPTTSFQDLHEDFRTILPGARKLQTEGSRDLWSPIVNVEYLGEDARANDRYRT